MPKIGVRLPAAFGSAGEFFADVQALEAAGADLIVLGDGPLDPVLLVAALAGVTSSVAVGTPRADAGQLATLRLLSRDRLAEDIEGWVEEPFPENRTAWRDTLAEHEAKGTPGVILAMDPRLLDLLRNPDLDDDRSQDLQLAQG
ncbi:MAG: hypothetical protein M3Z98_00115 [Candidatus Dormibacteraeota bacterium]|nr:hypothetical protein [Candidatus Dormibacteraeota bacterium]